MEKVLKKNNLILTALVVLLLLFGSLVMADTADAATTIGTVDSSIGLNVRFEPNTNAAIVAVLNDGDTVEVISTTGDWCQIKCNGITGYVAKKYLVISTVADYITDAEFEKMLTDEGFPESYKVELRKLHAAHPNWIFKAQNTGLSWEDVIAKESKVGTNLVHKSADDSWKSKEYGAYNWSTGQYVVFDSGGWVAASEGIVRYYMDPRNFLNDNNIFLFLQQSYNPLTQNEAGMQTLVANTFLAAAFPEAGYSTYSSALIYAAKQSGVNPYVLASMIIVEQGSDGRGNSISGKVKGYEGIYNYFNVRAYASGGYDAVEYGLMYAKQSGSYGRPWDTRLKSIVGGAQVYASGYINNRQDTLYLKKFNVMNGLANVGTHQYMTNVGGAVHEASNLKKGYNLSAALTFNVPVYKDMPTLKESMPASGNNDFYLKDLSVAGYDLLPAFDRYTENYEIMVPSDATKVSINATANSSSSKVSGAGNVSLTGNVTTVKVTVTASSGATKTYTITVAKESKGELTISSSKYNIGTQITGVGYETSVNTLKTNLSIPEGYALKVLNKSGKEITSGIVGTGCTVVVYDSKGSAAKSLPVVVKGDVNGDGKLSAADVLFAQRYIIGTYSMSGAYVSGADVSDDGKVSTKDVLFMQRHIIGTYKIQ